MSKRMKKQRPSGKHKVSQVRLNFEDEDRGSDFELKKSTFYDVDTNEKIQIGKP